MEAMEFYKEFWVEDLSEFLGEELADEDPAADDLIRPYDEEGRTTCDTRTRGTDSRPLGKAGDK